MHAKVAALWASGSIAPLVGPTLAQHWANELGERARSPKNKNVAMRSYVRIPTASTSWQRMKSTRLGVRKSKTGFLPLTHRSANKTKKTLETDAAGTHIALLDRKPRGCSLTAASRTCLRPSLSGRHDEWNATCCNEVGSAAAAVACNGTRAACRAALCRPSDYRVHVNSTIELQFVGDRLLLQLLS